MRYKQGHKEQVREKILDAAGELFRTNGFHGLGVDGLMAAAGMTSGAFYSNFASKEQLLEEFLERDLSRIRDYLRKKGEEDGGDWLVEFATDYINSLHTLNDWETCTMPVLTADLSRAGDKARQIYGDRLSEIVEALAVGTVGEDMAERRQNAWRFLGSLVGAVAIARALPPGQAAEEILVAAVEGARRLSGVNPTG